ncbi:MAG: hypothetical protein CVV06_06875, partial [Gammaproteobacteria bacterium HGW-Gammaproteobacteria-10]
MLTVKPAWKKWRLLNDHGRHIWAFKPVSDQIDQHLHNAETVSDEEIAQFAEDFRFDSSINPNSADQVYRHSAISNQFQPFDGLVPQAK